jgi:hypothetical protein
MIYHMKHTLIATAAVFLLVVLGSTGYTAAFTPVNSPFNQPRVHLKNGTSSNWSGYAIESNLKTPATGTVTNVQGSWVVPAVSCTNASTYSSMWVGIDGYSDNTVEQTGTEQDCYRKVPSYYAWYEIYPRSSVRITLPVKAGDTMTGSVQFSAPYNYTLTITDATTGKSYSTVQRLNGAGRESAEWVAEAPSSFFGVLPLSNFGTASFTNTSATLSGHSGTISDPAWQYDPLTMEYSPTEQKATPSALTTAGDGFTVTWDHS